MGSVIDKKGFTLLEVVVAIGLFIFTIFGTFALFSTSSRADRTVWESTFIQAQSSKIVQIFVDELRSANYSMVGGYPLAVATGTEIVFYANIDKDPLMERVHYFVSGTTFVKGITKPTDENILYIYDTSTEQFSDLIFGLQSPVGNVFTYYDSLFNGATVTSSMSYPVILPAVRMVGINLNIMQTVLSGSSVFQIQSKAQLRNLKTNQ